jgi:hypothetical protein
VDESNRRILVAHLEEQREFLEMVVKANRTDLILAASRRVYQLESLLNDGNNHTRPDNSGAN